MRSFAPLCVVALLCLNAPAQQPSSLAFDLHQVTNGKGAQGIESSSPAPALTPLINTVLFPALVGGTSVAYDATNDTFYLTYYYPGGDSCFVSPPSGEAHGQLISSSGQKIGPVSVFNAGECSRDVSVVDIGSRDMFLVAWWDIFDLWYRVVDAATGVAGPLRNGGPGGARIAPVSETSDAFLAVGSTPAGGGYEIRGWKLRVDASGRATFDSSRSIMPTAVDANEWISISRSGGNADRYLVVFSDKPGATWDLYGAVIDSDLNVLDSGPVLLTSDDALGAVVDGDGSKWRIAYYRTDFTVFPTYYETYTAGVFWNSANAEAWVGPSQLLNVGSRPAAIVWTGDSYSVNYSDGTTAHLATVDEFTGLACEVAQLPFNVDGPGASQKHGDPNGGDLGIAVGYGGAQLFRSNDGILTDLGGGCGSAKAGASCAVIGNQDFYLSVWDAPANTPTWLALSLATANLPCGPCTLIPSLGPLGVSVAIGNTDSLGNADIAAPIPNIPQLAGAVMYEQWLFLNGGGCFQFELSNALKVELQ